MGWLFVFGAVFLLAILPLGVYVVYNENGLAAFLQIGPARIPLRLKNGKGKEKKQKDTAVKQERLTGEKKSKEKENGGSLRDFQPLLKIALNLLGELRRKLRVNRLEVRLVLAGDDPCDLAVNYGKVWAAVGNLMPRLEQLLVIQKRDIAIISDFTATQTRVFVRIKITVLLGRLLYLLTRHGIPALREYSRIMNLRKGGMQT